MGQGTPQHHEQHWRDRFIAKSEIISDTFEVAKAYGARIAEWVLYGCLFANILEMFPLPFPNWFGDTVLAVQAITLDIAGFGLTTMGDHARRQGNEKAARTAQGMGWTLIGLMIVTVGLVTLSILIPDTKSFVDGTEKALILLRVVVTVLYGHIVHSLRQASVDYMNHTMALEQEVSSLRQTVSTLQPQLDSAKQQVDTLSGHLREKMQQVDTLSGQLTTEQHKVASLQLELQTEQGETTSLRQQMHVAQSEVETLQMQMEAKKQELQGLHDTMESSQQVQTSHLRHLLEAEQQRTVSLQQQLASEQDEGTTLRRHLNTALVEGEELRTQLEAKQQEIESKHIALMSEQHTVATLRTQVEAEQRRVSSLRQKLESGQSKKASTGQGKVNTGHEKGVDSGQGKVVQLDTSRRKGEQSDAAIEQTIRALMAVEPTISGRAIALRVPCSPTTANRWKSIIEREQDEHSEQSAVGDE
jgi:predicted  nucleic acid-binding Zn-ribbon protein